MDLIWKGKRILVPGGGKHLIYKPSSPEYDTVTIGTQVWMKENVKLDIPGSRVYNDNETNRPIYGGLYEFNMIPEIEAAFPGWHVPTLEEWHALSVTLGDQFVSGGHLKESGTTHWTSPNPADNSSQFTALPGGYYAGSYGSMGTSANFWTCTSQPDPQFAYFASMYNNSTSFASSGTLKTYSMSVRLIKDTPSQTVTDNDGNVYNTVTLGNQVWMKENLKTTTYSDGTPISNDRTNLEGAYAWYNNDINNKPVYGGMYSWYTVINSHGLAPSGWRIPSDSDWVSLISFIGGTTKGATLKETGLSHWLTPNTGATDQYGLTLLPGGFRHWNGNFYSLGTNGTFMSSTISPYGSTQSIAYSVYHNVTDISQVLPELARMASVRCVKDL